MWVLHQLVFFLLTAILESNGKMSALISCPVLNSARLEEMLLSFYSFISLFQFVFVLLLIYLLIGLFSSRTSVLLWHLFFRRQKKRQKTQPFRKQHQIKVIRNVITGSLVTSLPTNICHVLITWNLIQMFCINHIKYFTTILWLTKTSLFAWILVQK